MNWISKLVRRLLMVVATVLLGGFLCGILVRMAPGFDVDERQLDARLSNASVQALHAERAQNHHITSFYFGYLGKAAAGDFGISQTFGRPVGELITERFPRTLYLLGLGLTIAWLLAGASALVATMLRSTAATVCTTAVAGALLCTPSAVLALLLVFTNGPACLAVAAIVFPKLFQYLRNILADGYAKPHLVTARAKGMGEARILLWHVLPVSIGPLVALAGISVSVGLSACIPVEALCGIPGIGQLAWQAALGRDLPLLVTITMIVAALTIVANSGSDALSSKQMSER